MPPRADLSDFGLLGSKVPQNGKFHAQDTLDRGHIGQNNAKTTVQGPIAAKPEVEIWRRPDIST